MYTAHIVAYYMGMYSKYESPHAKARVLDMLDVVVHEHVEYERRAKHIASVLQRVLQVA